MRTLYLSLIIIMICGCKNSSKIQNDVEAISLTGLSENMLNMSQFVDSVQYIRLETTSDNLIGEVSQLIPLKDKFMIVDKEFTHSIYFFDKSGKYLSKIDRRGIAPDEYIKIQSAVVDSPNNRLFIYDSKRDKVLLYTMEGEYLESFHPDFFFTDIAYVGNQTLACYCDYGSNVDKLKVKDQVPVLVLYHLDTKEKETFCYEDVSIGTTELTDSHTFSSNNESLSLAYSLCNDIYDVSSQGVFKKYYLDFGKDEQASKEAYMLRLRSEDVQAEQVAYGDFQPDFFHQTCYLDSDKLLLVTYRNAKQNLMGFSICDKETKKQINGLKSNGWPVKNDIDNGYPLIPYALKGRQMYTVVPPDYFEDKEITDPALTHLIANMTSDDNPIIMISTVTLK